MFEKEELIRQYRESSDSQIRDMLLAGKDRFEEEVYAAIADEGRKRNVWGAVNQWYAKGITSQLAAIFIQSKQKPDIDTFYAQLPLFKEKYAESEIELIKTIIAFIFGQVKKGINDTVIIWKMAEAGINQAVARIVVKSVLK